VWDKRDQGTFADRVEQQIERFAPGFQGSIITRTVTAPPQLARHRANLVGGAILGGTTQLHQPVYRPITGLGRPKTPSPACNWRRRPPRRRRTRGMRRERRAAWF
jgi:phytoene dehydrogenase-like protein